MNEVAAFFDVHMVEILAGALLATVVVTIYGVLHKED